jgi:hypothetical protein
VHNLCTNEVKRLRPGQGCEAFITNLQGKTLGHGWIFRSPSGVEFNTVPGQGGVLLPHFEKYHVREELELHDDSDQFTTYWCGDLSSAEQSIFGMIAPASEPFSHEEIRLANTAVRAARVPVTDPGDLILTASKADEGSLNSWLNEHFGPPCDVAEFESRRISEGTPWFGVDIHSDNLPQEVARDRSAISFVKGCYLGQETVARIDALGHVNRLLVRISAAGSGEPWSVGSSLVFEGKTVGKICSTAYSSRLRRIVAHAYVRRELAKEGQLLHAEDGRAVTVFVGRIHGYL